MKKIRLLYAKKILLNHIKVLDIFVANWQQWRRKYAQRNNKDTKQVFLKTCSTDHFCTRYSGRRARAMRRVAGWKNRKSKIFREYVYSVPPGRWQQGSEVTLFAVLPRALLVVTLFLDILLPRATLVPCQICFGVPRSGSKWRGTKRRQMVYCMYTLSVWWRLYHAW